MHARKELSPKAIIIFIFVVVAAMVFLIVLNRSGGEDSVGILDRNFVKELEAKGVITQEGVDSFLQSCLDSHKSKGGEVSRDAARACGCAFNGIANAAVEEKLTFYDFADKFTDERNYYISKCASDNGVI